MKAFHSEALPVPSNVTILGMEGLWLRQLLEEGSQPLPSISSESDCEVEESLSSTSEESDSELGSDRQ